MSTALNNRPEKIHALTSLRFFAAFYVVLFHTVPLVFGDRMQATLTQRAISLGYVSVSFFFLLSGYILAMVYLRSGRPIDKRNFSSARFARVYPLFLVTLLADTPFVLLSRMCVHFRSEFCLHGGRHCSDKSTRLPPNAESVLRSPYSSRSQRSRSSSNGDRPCRFQT
jgi:hypothetical protein